MENLEPMLLRFLERKYVQSSDERQHSMGLQYMHAETHDLAREIANFIRRIPSQNTVKPDSA